MDKDKELSEILGRHFGITVHENQLDTESNYLKKIQTMLAERIAFFINTDVEKLFQILYKVDVSPQLTDEAFDRGELKQVSMRLAELIIQRQLRKIDYARKFYGDKE